MRVYATKNRHNDIVMFTEVEENIFTFETFDEDGNKAKYWRKGYDDEKTLYIDPPGGPFVGIGTDFSRLGNNFPPLIVEKIDELNRIHVK